MRTVLAGAALATFGVLSVTGCGQTDDARFASSAGALVTQASSATNAAGCADGEREGFLHVAAHPNIAGCSGAWTIPGIHTENPGVAPACPSMATADTTVPACERQAGDDGANPQGIGCNVADLCAPGWHVCAGSAEVAERSQGGCAWATPAGSPPLFFATRQSSNGCGVCATGTSTASWCNSATCNAGCLQTASTSNDVFGCGNFGSPIASSSTCSPLDRFSHNLCSGLAGSPWSCNLPTGADNNGLCEAYAVTKSGVTHGGVLCCRDPNQPPDCSGASAAPAELWPPDHEMVAVQIAGVVDPDDGDAVSIEIASIFQDEPVDGSGDGSTESDGAGLGTGTAWVRAERSGNKAVPGNGRVYHVSFVATDHAGATCSGVVTTCVPHDQRPGASCVDDGPLYESTAR